MMPAMFDPPPDPGDATQAAPPVPPGATPSTPPALDKPTREWAMWMHLATFAGLVVPFGHIVAPLILWMQRREENAFLDRHGREALNFQLLETIVFTAILVPATCMGLFLPPLWCIIVPLLVVMGVLSIVATVQAAMAAQKGQWRRYPVQVDFIRRPPAG